MLTLNDGRAELWQWDTGRTLAVDADCSQVHFSNKVFGRSIDVDVIDGSAIIPDVLLQTEKDLNVWAFVGTAENGYTKISKTFNVNRRNKPADYVFTPQEQITLKDATAILEEAKDVANDAMETAKKAEAIADKAVQIADEMKMLAEQVEQNAETATKAKTDALTAQTKAEEARNAAEIAKKAADKAANSAGTDASAASAAATRAQNAANDAAASLSSIQVLYQEMQEYVSQSVQDIQTEGNTQVQRVADEGAAQISAAKGQADRAKAEANRAEAARAKAEEVVENCIPDDTAVDGKPWTSKNIVDSLCIPFEESGNPVQCYSVENYPLGIKLSWEPTQAGEGDPSPDNIRPITGRDAVSVTRCGKNLFSTKNAIGVSINGITNATIEDNRIVLSKTDGNAWMAYRAKFDIPAGQYTVSLQATCSDEAFTPLASIYYIDKYTGKSNVVTLINGTGARTIKIPNGKYLSIYAHLSTEASYTGERTTEYSNIQIEPGSTATPYEPYTGYTTDIALPETVYGGTLDVETGVMTVDTGCAVFTGEETFQVHNFGYHVAAKNAKITNAETQYNAYCISSHYAGSSWSELHKANNNLALFYGASRLIFNVKNTYASTDEFKSYLNAQYKNGTPVTATYVLETPYTIQLTPQQIAALSGVNTIYTDADGVVVTGAEDPKHTITELKNAIISLGGNV